MVGPESTITKSFTKHRNTYTYFFCKCISMGNKDPLFSMVYSVTADVSRISRFQDKQGCGLSVLWTIRRVVSWNLENRGVHYVCRATKSFSMACHFGGCKQYASSCGVPSIKITWPLCINDTETLYDFYHKLYCRSATIDPPSANLYPHENHHNDVIMTPTASQITSLTIVYSKLYSGADRRKPQSSASLAFMMEFTGDRWILRTKGQ